MNPRTVSIVTMTGDHQEEAMAIYNHYILHTFAAYREDPLPVGAFSAMLTAASGYPAKVVLAQNASVLGFGMLRPHKSIPEFRHVAEFMCFMHPDCCGGGLGRMLLHHLEREGDGQGISILLAHISSRNAQSLRFHARNGFSECGRFVGVGKKHGVSFDTIWMQKML